MTAAHYSISAFRERSHRQVRRMSACQRKHSKEHGAHTTKDEPPRRTVRPPCQPASAAGSARGTRRETICETPSPPMVTP
jgi:hypothetical protein